MNETAGVKILCPKMTMSHTSNPSHFSFNTGLVVCVVNGALAAPTAILNLLLIVSILTTPNLRRPSYILICALAFCDFGVGFLVQPLYVARKITFMISDHGTYCSLLQAGNAVAHICCTPSIFIITAIGIDRYLAIHLKTAYSNTVTIKVVLLYIGCALFCAGCITLGRFHATSPKYMSIAAVLLCVSLAVILYCYYGSLKGLKASQLRVKSEQSRENSRVSRASSHRQVLSTLLLIVTTLFCCYFPFVAVVVTMSVHGRSKEFMIAWEMGLTLLYLNSLLNPLIHFARLQELREAWALIVKKN